MHFWYTLSSKPGPSSLWILMAALIILKESWLISILGSLTEGAEGRGSFFPDFSWKNQEKVIHFCFSSFRVKLPDVRLEHGAESPVFAEELAGQLPAVASGSGQGEEELEDLVVQKAVQASPEEFLPEPPPVAFGKSNTPATASAPSAFAAIGVFATPTRSP